MTQDIVEDLNQNSEKKNNIITQTALDKAIEDSTDFKPDNLLRYGSAVFRKSLMHKEELLPYVFQTLDVHSSS